MKNKTKSILHIIIGTFILGVIGILITFNSFAEGLILVDPSSGKYLGNYNNNPTDPNSINNPSGKYGSTSSPNSVNNKSGKYGSSTSEHSGNNPYATSAPIIIHQKD